MNRDRSDARSTLANSTGRRPHSELRPSISHPLRDRSRCASIALVCGRDPERTGLSSASLSWCGGGLLAVGGRGGFGGGGLFQRGRVGGGGGAGAGCGGGDAGAVGQGLAEWCGECVVGGQEQAGGDAGGRAGQVATGVFWPPVWPARTAAARARGSGPSAPPGPRTPSRTSTRRRGRPLSRARRRARPGHALRSARRPASGRRRCQRSAAPSSPRPRPTPATTTPPPQPGSQVEEGKSEHSPRENRRLTWDCAGGGRVHARLKVEEIAEQIVEGIADRIVEGIVGPRPVWPLRRPSGGAALWSQRSAARLPRDHARPPPPHPPHPPPIARQPGRRGEVRALTTRKSGSDLRVREAPGYRGGQHPVRPPV
ncbi:hypothetical protein HEB29_005822 [Streptomyces fulvorobeus]|uniref:Uncharacterized protein n=1 Tax=Streptomyces fulvorobeus TaxID=284028 RepID=A0A7Y9HHW6_9ACTN|nr:hypothetical protein [Streptomyces fulvorobeus]